MNCIPKHLVNEFLSKIKSGEITPEKMMEMTSKERREYFSKFLGEVNAKEVNALFESKMGMKSIQEGIVSWANQVAGLKPEVHRDIVSKAEKMSSLLTPEKQEAFLADLVEHKLGMAVTLEEAGNIATLAKDVSQKEQAIKQGGNRMEYGRARVAFEDYVNGLKEEATRKTLKDWVKPSNWGIGITNVAGIAKSMKASFDNSVIGRQGLKTLFTEPKIWAKNSAESFVNFYRSMKGVNVMEEVRADVLSRPNSLNGLYKKERLAVGVTEEAYPTSLPEKAPILGRFFKASQDAFTAWQYRTRADVFDRYVDIANKSGADIKGIGKVVNALTGRGDIGALEPVSKPLNNIFFAPRFLKSNIDLLTAHAMDKDMSPFARKKAAENMVKVVFGVAGVLAIAKAIDPDSVDFDPRSANFGKIKVGNTRFDVSGGMSSIVTLASRVITLSSKSGTTGIVTPINSDKYGAKTAWDVMGSFFEGKLSPASGLVRDLFKGKDFQGKKVTFWGEAGNLLMPLPITNFNELKNGPNSAPILAALIADGLGIGTNTYSGDADWTQSTSKALTQFKSVAGEEKFKEANIKFNMKFNEWFSKIREQKSFKSLDGESQKKLISTKKEQIKKKIFAEYKFSPKAERSPLKNQEVQRLLRGQ